VVHVKPRSWRGGDEKLAPVRARACIGHGENTRLIELQITGAFVFKVFAPDGLTSAACAGRVAALNHKLLNDTVKDDTVVVAILAVRSEILASFGSDLGEEIECDGALGSFECDFHS
jgi:hypothetical protein